jgi:RNA recognition motif-containing protein
MVGARVFIGNLPYAVSEEQLRELLSPIANVLAVSLPGDRLTGKPHGLAFVDVANEQDAREMIREFNGYMLDTRRLRVEQATDRTEQEYLPKHPGAARRDARGRVRPRPKGKKVR